MVRNLVGGDTPEPAFALLGEQSAEPLPSLRQCRRERAGVGGAQGCGVGRAEAEIGRAGEFALGHRDATGELTQIFAVGELQDQRLRLA